MSESYKIWTTRDGNKIKIEDMTSQHILNTIRCIKNEKIGFVVNCGYAMDNDYIEYFEDTETKECWINTFKKELKRRGINYE